MPEECLEGGSQEELPITGSGNVDRLAATEAAVKLAEHLAWVGRRVYPEGSRFGEPQGGGEAQDPLVSRSTAVSGVSLVEERIRKLRDDYARNKQPRCG
jgi:hypothetical protein